METKIKIRYKDKCVNEVPPETIIRHLSVEKGKLEAENAELRDTLKRRDDAIRSFKVWQKKVVEYNVNYWLNEGVKFLDEKPNPQLLNVVRAVAERNRVWKELEHKVEKAYKATIQADVKFYDLLTESDLNETAKVLFPKNMVKLPTGKMIDMNEDNRLAWLEGVEFGRNRLVKADKEQAEDQN